jgi:hypothetical protein
LTGDVRERLHSLNDEWLSLARQGRFDEAWQVSDLAQRLRGDMECSHWSRHQQFIWRGAPLTGRRVLIRCYHGLGDTIQFVRFVPRVRQIAREVTLWVQPQLIPLLASMRCIDRLLPLHDGAPDVDYDIDVELFELMHVLRVSAANLTEGVPYLRVDQPQAKRRAGALRVGLVWAAGEWDGRRSVPCEQLGALGLLRDIDWWLMQRGPALAQWSNGFGRAPEIHTILDEAQALRGLDLLITVDTCSAHLAGALGVPVWTLLQHEADWRWMDHRTDTPWYPTMRLFRQHRPGDWPGVLRGVETELRAYQFSRSTRCSSASR